MNRSLISLLPLTIVALALSIPAVRAGCHLIDCVEDVYIGPQQLNHASCETLWILRNSIFKDAKYCFRSERGLKWFANEDCIYAEQEEVPLNDYQRSNVDVIKSVETKRGC